MRISGWQRTISVKILEKAGVGSRRRKGEEEIPFAKRLRLPLHCIIIGMYLLKFAFGVYMKKFFLSVIVAVALASAVFAADDVSKASFSIGFSFPQIYNLNTADKNIDSEKYSAFGLNLAFRTVIGLPFGIYFDGNLYFPYAHKITMDDVEYRYDLKDANLWGIEGQIGVYSVLLNTGRFALPFGGGIHLNFQGTDYKNSATNKPNSQTVFSFGVGGWINAELQVTEKFTLYGSLHLDYDFWQRIKTETKISSNGTKISTESGMSSMLFLIPIVGAIIRF